MRIERRRTADEHARNFIRCSVCGQRNDRRKRPSGGEYARAHQTMTTYSLEGQTVSLTRTVKLADNSFQGCLSCQSPAWRTGGRRGDL